MKFLKDFFKALNKQKRREAEEFFKQGWTPIELASRDIIEVAEEHLSYLTFSLCCVKENYKDDVEAAKKFKENVKPPTWDMWKAMLDADPERWTINNNITIIDKVTGVVFCVDVISDCWYIKPTEEHHLLSAKNYFNRFERRVIINGLKYLLRHNALLDSLVSRTRNKLGELYGS